MPTDEGQHPLGRTLGAARSGTTTTTGPCQARYARHDEPTQCTEDARQGPQCHSPATTIRSRPHNDVTLSRHDEFDSKHGLLVLPRARVQYVVG
ncbi:hypothetical protein BDZ89DRAFT_1085238, partial [Hymenopellis radicata]